MGDGMKQWGNRVFWIIHGRNDPCRWLLVASRIFLPVNFRDVISTWTHSKHCALKGVSGYEVIGHIGSWVLRWKWCLCFENAKWARTTDEARFCKKHHSFEPYRKFHNKGFNRFFSHEFQYILNIWMKNAINIPCNTTRWCWIWQELLIQWTRPCKCQRTCMYMQNKKDHRERFKECNTFHNKK